MPRKRKTQPGPGGAYVNRTDMTQPPTAAPGQAYGNAGEQIAAQEAMPLPQTQEVDPFSKAVQAAKQFTFNAEPINTPSARPNEPVTAGLDTGPGPGYEVLGLRRGLSDLLTRLAAETENETIRDMMDNARRMGL